MKIKPSPLVLKIVILISALIAITSVIWNTVYMYQSGLFSYSPEIPGLKVTAVEHFIVGALYMLMAVYLFKLVGGTSNREIISRKNLMFVRGILYVLLALLFTRIAFALFVALGPIGSTQGLTFKLITLLGSCWEPLMGSLVIYVLAIVFKRAVILKEEEALTI